jgi:hypothetical protein
MIDYEILSLLYIIANQPDLKDNILPILIFNAHIIF